jgi:hypothetical protein
MVRRYGDPTYRLGGGANVPAVARTKLIENAFKATAEFQSDAAVIETKIDELRNGLSDISALFSSQRFTK